MFFARATIWIDRYTVPLVVRTHAWSQSQRKCLCNQETDKLKEGTSSLDRDRSHSRLKHTILFSFLVFAYDFFYYYFVSGVNLFYLEIRQIFIFPFDCPKKKKKTSNKKKECEKNYKFWFEKKCEIKIFGKKRKKKKEKQRNLQCIECVSDDYTPYSTHNQFRQIFGLLDDSTEKCFIFNQSTIAKRIQRLRFVLE